MSVRPIVVPPHPDWGEQASTLIALLGGLDVPGRSRVDHIGSTAIPGMAAKDVLDVQMSVTDLDPAADALDRHLPAHGFVRQPFDRDHVPAGSEDDPEVWAKRVWARRGHADPDVNLHVRRAGSPGERVALLFRDWFRAHPDAIAAYAAFKLALATEVPTVDAYSDVKDPVVDLVLVVAERWAAEVGWRP